MKPRVFECPICKSKIGEAAVPFAEPPTCGNTTACRRKRSKMVERKPTTT